jgi:hypothetical protein
VAILDLKSFQGSLTSGIKIKLENQVCGDSFKVSHVGVKTFEDSLIGTEL